MNRIYTKEEIDSHPVIQKHGTSFCCAPWNAIWTSSDGDVRFCCASNATLGNIKNDSMINIMNSNQAQAIRADFLNNKKPESCRQCWESERGGTNYGNPRWLSNQQGCMVIEDSLKHTDDDGTIHKHNLKFVDLIWTNKCNFACLHCKPDISSAVADSYEEVFPIWLGDGYKNKFKDNRTDVVVDNKDKLNYILENSDQIEQIHFNGGEPLMQEETFELIDALMARGLNKQINLWFHTNGSIRTYKNIDIVDDYLKPWGSNCKITMSHDIHGARGEYFRYGYSERKWLELFNKYHEAGITLTVQTSYTLFNALCLDELAKWYEDNNITNRAGMKITYIIDPMVWNFLNLGITPELKAQVLAQLQAGKRIKGWGDILDNCARLIELPFDCTEAKEKFIRSVTALDVKRKTNFVQTFPELRAFTEALSNVPNHIHQ